MKRTMPRTPFVAGNWKMNTTKAQAVELARGIARGIPSGGVQVGVAPPFVYIDAVAQAVQSSNLLVGAQDVCAENFGAFTGESERRHVYHEPSELVARKAHAVYEGGMILIHCVGEKLAERDSGKAQKVVEQQLEELDPAKIDDPQRLVIAYEPVWAIGTGRTATDDQAQEMHLFIRDVLEKRWNATFANDVRIQYGGSMKPENARGLLKRNDVDGGLIGGAALKAESFLGIVNAAL